jgi:hypothetical protein
MTVNVKNLIVPFLLGGTIIAGVKFAASNASPGVAAIIGGVPTGLISIYFLTSDSISIEYSYNYFFNTVVLAMSILCFYLAQSNTKIHKNVMATLAIAFWILGVSIVHFVESKQKK